MIYDSLCNYAHYIPATNPEEFKKAIDFLKGFSPDTPVGKHVLVEGKIYANVQEYDSVLLEKAVIEYHRDFIDLQTVISGEEQIFYAPLCELQEQKAYDESGDYGLYTLDTKVATSLRIEPGMFAIFFPGEGHAPCVAIRETPVKVKKVVLKLHRSLFC